MTKTMSVTASPRADLGSETDGEGHIHHRVLQCSRGAGRRVHARAFCSACATRNTPIRKSATSCELAICTIEPRGGWHCPRLRAQTASFSALSADLASCKLPRRGGGRLQDAELRLGRRCPRKPCVPVCRTSHAVLQAGTAIESASPSSRSAATATTACWSSTSRPRSHSPARCTVIDRRYRLRDRGGVACANGTGRGAVEVLRGRHAHLQGNLTLAARRLRIITHGPLPEADLSGNGEAERRLTELALGTVGTKRLRLGSPAGFAP